MTRRAPAVLLLCIGAACAARTAAPTDTATTVDISAVRQAQRELAYQPTGNFQGHGAVDAICYWTGPFELPVDYAGLRFRQGRCPRRAAGQDVFLYEPEALAGRQTPVTTSLAEAAPARRAFVVAHEDFHDQPGVRQLEPALKEAYSTLAGLLTAAEAVRVEQGADSDAYREALREAELFRRKSQLVNRYHGRLVALYAELGAGRVSPQEALRKKALAFEELAAECAEVETRPRAFAVCPAVLNNAGLAFDATYTRRFEEAWAIYESTARNPAAAIALMRP